MVAALEWLSSISAFWQYCGGHPLKLGYIPFSNGCAQGGGRNGPDTDYPSDMTNIEGRAPTWFIGFVAGDRHGRGFLNN
jgi:hypothetical protein